MRTVGSGMADGNQGHGLKTIHGKKLLDECHIEIAHPTRAKSLLGGSQTQMLRGYGHIDVAMWLVVVGTYPLATSVAKTDDIHGRRGEPTAVVALAQTSLGHFGTYYEKLPRLPVAGRRSQAHSLKHSVQLPVVDRLGRKAAHGMATGD